MEAVKAFNQELSSLYECKPPISRGKMTSLTKSAIKAIKLYKHVVQSVEKFIQKCRPEYKVPGLYVIDSIVRQSRHQFGREKDVFAPRFSKNINVTFSHLFKCLPEDKAKIVRVLNLWQKNSVFSAEIIQPLLDLANPENADSPDSPPPAAVVEKTEKKRVEPDWLKEQASQAVDNQHKKQVPSPQKKSRSHRHSHEDKTLALVSNLLMQAQEGSSEHQQLQQLQLIQETIQKQTKSHQARPANKETLKLDEAVLKQIQNLTKQLTSLANQGAAALSDTEEAETAKASPPPQPIEEPPPPAAPQEKAETSFNSALLEFDYGDEEDDSPTKRKSPPPAAPVPAPEENPPLPPQAPPEKPAVTPPKEPEVSNLQASLEAVQKLTDELNHAQNQQEQMQQYMEQQEQQIRHHIPPAGIIQHDQQQISHHIPPPSMIQPPPPMVPPQLYQGPPPYPIPLPPMTQPPLPAAPPTSVPFTTALPAEPTTSEQYQPEFPSEDVPTRISDSPIRETSDVPVVVEDSPPPIEAQRSRSRSPRKKRGRSRSKSRSRSPHSSKRKHRSKRRHRSRSRSKERSRSRRSRSRSSDRSRDRSRSHRHDREEREEQEDHVRRERKRGFPSIRENKASVCSLTIWMGRLPKSVSEKEIKYLIEENGGGEVKSVHIVSARGCAYVLMTDRAEAAKVLDNLKYAKLHGSNIKVAWAPGVGVKDKKYKDYWDVDRGVSYIPWDIFSRHPEKLDELEEDSYVDVESLPEELRKLRQPPEEEPPESEEQGSSEPDNQIPVHTGVPPPGAIPTDLPSAPPVQQPPITHKDSSPPSVTDTSAPPPRFVGIPPGAPVMRMPVMPGGVMPPIMGIRLPPGLMPPAGGVMTPPRMPPSTSVDMPSGGEPEPVTTAPSIAPPPPFMRPGMPLGPQVLETMRHPGSPTPQLIGQMPNRLLLPPRIAGLSLPVPPGGPDNKIGGPEAPSEGKGLLGSPPGLPPGAVMLLESQRKNNNQESVEQPQELGGAKDELDHQEKVELPPPPVSLFGDLSQFAGPALRMVRPTLGQPMLPQGMMPGLVSIPRMVVPGGAMVRLPGQGIPVSLAGLRLAAAAPGVMPAAGLPPRGLPPRALPPGALPPGGLPPGGLPPGGLPPGGLPPGMLPPVPPEIMNLLRPPIPTIETPDEQPEEDAPKDVDERVIPDYGASSPFQKEGSGEDMFDNGPPAQEVPKEDQDFRAKDSDLREPWPRPPRMPDFRGPPPPFRPEFTLRGPRPPWGPPFRGPPPRGMPPMGPGRPPFRGPPPGDFGPRDGPGGWGMDQDWRHGPPPPLLDQDFRGGHDQDWRPRPWGMDQGMSGGPPFPDGPPEERGGFNRDSRNRDFDHRRERGGRNWDRNRENDRNSDRDRSSDRDDRSSDRRERGSDRGERGSDRGDRASDRGDRDHRRERDHDYRTKGREQGGQDSSNKSDGDKDKKEKKEGKPKDDEAPSSRQSGDPEKTKRKSRWAPVTNEAPPKPLLDIVIPPMKLKPHLTGPSPLAEDNKPMVPPTDSKPPGPGKFSPVKKDPPPVDATTPVKDEKPIFDEKTPVRDEKVTAAADDKPGSAVNSGPVVAPSSEIKTDSAQPNTGAAPPHTEIGSIIVAKEVNETKDVEGPPEGASENDKS